MSKWKLTIGLVAMLCVAALLVGQVYSQAGGGRGAGVGRSAGARGGFGGRAGGMRGGGFNFEEMQQRMMERMKESLEADDAQWSKMGPLLAKVMELQRELRSGSRFGMFGRGGFGGRGGFMGSRGAGGVEGRGPAAGQGRGPAAVQGRGPAAGQGRGPAAGQGRGPAAGQGRGPAAGQGRRSRDGSGRPDRPQTDIQKKSQALQASLEDMLADDAKVNEQLAALRAAKKKVKTELEKTQLALAKIVKPRQEARLVLMGYLD